MVCIPIWAWGSLSLDSHNNSDIVDAGNLMYPSHGGTQAASGRVQSDPAGDPFVCGQCSTTGQLSMRGGLRMFQVLPVTVTSNQVVVMHHMPAACLSRCASLGGGLGRLHPQPPRPVRRLPTQGTQKGEGREKLGSAEGLPGPSHRGSESPRIRVAEDPSHRESESPRIRVAADPSQRRSKSPRIQVAADPSH